MELKDFFVTFFACVGALIGSFINVWWAKRTREQDKQEKQDRSYLKLAEHLEEFAKKCEDEINEGYSELGCIWYDQSEDGWRNGGCEYKRKAPRWGDKVIFEKNYFDDFELPIKLISKMRSISNDFDAARAWVSDCISENLEYFDEEDRVNCDVQVYAYYGRIAVSESIEIRKIINAQSESKHGLLESFNKIIEKFKAKYVKGEPWSECRIMPELKIIS